MRRWGRRPAGKLGRARPRSAEFFDRGEIARMVGRPVFRGVIHGSPKRRGRFSPDTLSPNGGPLWGRQREAGRAETAGVSPDCRRGAAPQLAVDWSRPRPGAETARCNHPKVETWGPRWTIVSDYESRGLGLACINQPFPNKLFFTEHRGPNRGHGANPLSARCAPWAWLRALWTKLLMNLSGHYPG